MDRISRQVFKHRKAVVIWTVVLCVICCVLFFGVRVNYNMADYLPADAPSTQALHVMNEEFTGDMPNLSVMVENVSIPEALDIKKKIAAVEGVSSVLWLDDVQDIATPLETMDQNTLNGYYKDGAALFSVSVKEGFEQKATDEIDALIGPSNALSGDAMNLATMQKLSVSECVRAIMILLPIILLILFLTTSSYLEPLLYLCAIGAAVLINMGTNIFFEDISFITQAVSPILQLAVSLDYSIILLRAFQSYRAETDSPEEAMRLALKRAVTAISSSAATTLFGFAVLLLMRFEIGADLGLNLVKGVALSFLSVMLFLPALTLLCLKALDKTRHKELFKSKGMIGSKLLKVRIPCLILVLIIIVPCFLAAQNNSYIYGSGASAPTSRGGLSAARIAERFSNSSSQVVLIKRGNPAAEKLLSEELSELPHVTAVTSYASMAGSTIPNEYISAEITDQFYSENYARIIVTADTETEGEEAFALVEQIRAAAQKYDEDALVLGESVNLYDMKTVIESDTAKINLIAIAAILLVLLLALKSPLLPILLVFTIESAIYINLACAYFSGSSLCYIGYLVLSTVQLGATVDYAIMQTDAYRRARQTLGKREAVAQALSSQLGSILISGSILAAAGFCLMLTSTNPIVSELGLLLGRGTLLSVALVLFVLPALLLIFDKAILKTAFGRAVKKEGVN